MTQFDTSNESRRVGRYVVAKAVSGGGSTFIFIALWYLHGSSWLIASLLLAKAFDYLVDFWAQKLWVFKERDTSLRTLLREFVLYCFIRIVVLTTSGVVGSLLYFGMGVSLLWTLILVNIVFLVISFGLYRFLFTFKASVVHLSKKVHALCKRARS